jgi:glutamate racemase
MLLSVQRVIVPMSAQDSTPNTVASKHLDREQKSGPSYIGVLDSGVGGLSVLREIHRLLPDRPTLYFADQGHLPYGPRPAEEILSFVDAITRFLLDRGAAAIVIACNSASANSLEAIRARYPDIPFVGMEPAVKPAVEATRTGVIGVLATRATAEGHLYKRVVERYARNTRVITQITPELVEIVEAKSQHIPESRAVIQHYIQPLLDAGADQIALACTHFPFLIDTLRDIVGPNIGLIDPGPAVARQTVRVLPPDMPKSDAPHQYFTSGSAENLKHMLKLLVGIESDVTQITSLTENQY